MPNPELLATQGPSRSLTFAHNTLVPSFRGVGRVKLHLRPRTLRREYEYRQIYLLCHIFRCSSYIRLVLTFAHLFFIREAGHSFFLFLVFLSAHYRLSLFVLCSAGRKYTFVVTTTTTGLRGGYLSSSPFCFRRSEDVSFVF